MLEIRNVTREFPGVRALDNVSASFEKGEIHALMGENGAGKSTLMKIITGIYHPDAGEVCIDGRHVEMRSYRDSVKHSISMVHQEIQVIPGATVAENIILDKLEKYTSRLGQVNWKKINEDAAHVLKLVELNIQPTDIIGGMTAAQKQLIQIAKALASNAEYILMDEPTSSLSRFESENLFRIARKLRDQGCCIIFVSHKIEEVMELCDRVTVLRDGKSMGTRNIAEITRQDLVRMMIGREENISHLGDLNISDEVVVEMRDVGKAGLFEGMNLKLHRGEILGLYGLVGSGRTELMRLLVGADKMDTGAVFINGEQAKIVSLKDTLLRHHIGYVTENRKEEGLLLGFPVLDNLTITVLDQCSSRIKKLNHGQLKQYARDMIDRMQIKTPSQETLVGTLSGGNQQKVSIGKWLIAGCDILVIDEPTIGVDVGAKRHIHEIIWDLAKNRGKSIILISSDMSEMLTLARRILVFRDRKIVDEINDLNGCEVDYKAVGERIGNAMA